MSDTFEPVTVTIKKMKLTDVYVEGLTPLDMTVIANEIEQKMNEIALRRNTVDSLKLALYACLYYAGNLQLKNNRKEKRTQEDEKQLDSAIEKLTLALNRLPLD